MLQPRRQRRALAQQPDSPGTAGSSQEYMCPMPGCGTVMPSVADLPAHMAAAHSVATAGPLAAPSTSPRHLHIVDNPKVWPHQKKAYAELQEMYHEVQKGGCNAWRYLLHFCTGAGKTSMLVLAPHALHSNRTLMLSPNKKTCDEIVGKMKGTKDGTRMSFLRDVGALLGNDEGPKVMELTEPGKVLQNHQKMSELKAFDIIVATASKVSNLKPEAIRGRKSEKAKVDEAVGPSGEPKRKKAKRGENMPMSEAIAAFAKETKKMLQEQNQPLFDAIIFDEAHHCPATTWKLILSELYDPIEWVDTNGVRRKPSVLFLTGSPSRIRDATDFPIDRQLTPFTLKEAMQQHELPGGHCIGPFVKDIVFLNVVAEVEGQEKGELDCQMECMKVMAHVLTEKRRGSSIPHRALIEVETLKKGHELCDAVNASEDLLVGPGKRMRAAVIKGNQAPEIQEKLMLAFQTHNMDDAIDVLINCKMLGEGFDDPLLSVCGVFKGHRTVSPFEQFVGRCVRPNRKGQGTRVQDKDQVCHIITHAMYNQVPIFSKYASQAAVDEEDEDGAAASLATLNLTEGASDDEGFAEPGAGSDEETTAALLLLNPLARAVHVHRYMFNKRQQRTLVENEDKHYFADLSAWSVTNREVE